MNAVSDPELIAAPPRWRFSITPAIEIGVLSLALVMGAVTYAVLHHVAEPAKLLSPGITALLLLGNLMPIVALLVLIGRRIAKGRAAHADMIGEGRLHVRLVATFSVIASVPIILTVIAASVMFQSVNQFWVSSRAENAFASTVTLAEDAQRQYIDRWINQAKTMAQDIADHRAEYRPNTPIFNQYLEFQSYNRLLSQAVVFEYNGRDGINIVGVCNYPDLCAPPDQTTFDQRITRQRLELVRQHPKPIIDRTPDTIWVIVPINGMANYYLYIATQKDAAFLDRQHIAASDVIRDYGALQGHSRGLQLKFNAALFAVAVLIVALTVWIALAVADRLVRPVNDLVRAARQVADGDLAVRVPDPRINDEVGTLGRAFNVMTARLQAQTTALENRRALIEAVMSGVSAGVVSIGPDRTIQLANSSARMLLNANNGDLVGQQLSDIIPELGPLLDSDAREGIVQVSTEGEPKTLAVKITRDATGQVLTFDDITQQLLDQRRAAWSDVARRIAHEIKNPLTPIQLAAERLQRRYGKQFEATDGTFHRLTDTIVRQVGDLRRMVDEFSSFARMPKPVFRAESLIDIARQALFLHEVAHANVRFSLDCDEAMPSLVCDRRQIGQALTNLVKNAVEAIEARGEEAAGEVTMTIGHQEPGTVTVSIADDGVGLPAERSRLVEPYMTTRLRGTGLGLAIVKKIAEEHFGTITFDDRPGGGTIVTMRFDAAMLAAVEAPHGALSRSGRRPSPSCPHSYPEILTHGARYSSRRR